MSTRWAKPTAPRLRAGHPLARGLAHAWVARDDLVILPDVVGGNNATLSGSATLEGAPWGKSPFYDKTGAGTSGYHAASKAINFRPTERFSIGLTLMLASTSGGPDQCFIGNQGLGGNTKGWSYDWAFYDHIEWYWRVGDSEQMWAMIYIPTMVANEPQRHVLTYDGSLDGYNIKFYIDGVLRTDSFGVLSNSMLANSQPDNATPPQIGRLNGQMNGAIDGVMIWRNRTLTPQEVALDAQDPFGVVRPRRRSMFCVSGAAITTGTFTPTLAGVTPELTGLGASIAAFTPTLGDTTASLTGLGASVSTFTPTLGSETISATATHTAPANSDGTFTPTLGSATASAEATHTAPASSTATSEPTLGSATASLDATHTAPANSAGTFEPTLDGATASLSASYTGAGESAGTFTPTLGSTTVVASPSATAPANSAGTFTPTLGSKTVSIEATAGAAPQATTPAFRARPSALRIDRNHPLSRDLASAWLVGGAGLVHDPASRNPVTLTGTTVLASRYGPIAHLAGTAYGTAARAINFAPTHPFSFALTFSADSVVSSIALASNLTVATNKGWEILVGSGGSLAFSLAGGFSNYIYQAASTTLSAGQIYRIAVSYDGRSAAAGVRFYVDGRPVANAGSPIDTLTAGSDTASSQLPRLGQRTDGDRQLAGNLGAVLVWNRVISAAEALADAADPYGPLRPRLRNAYLAPSSMVATFTPTLGGASASLDASAAGGPSTGTFEPTLASATASLTASAAVAGQADGTFETTLGSATVSADATNTAPAASAGTFTPTLADASASISASNTAAANSAATFAPTLGSATASISATFAAAGVSAAAFAPTMGSATAAAEATAGAPASSTTDLSSTLAGTSVAVTAIHGTAAAGTFAPTMGSATASFVANTVDPGATLGTLAPTLGSAAVALVGANIPTASLALTLANATAALTGTRTLAQGSQSTFSSSLGGSTPALDASAGVSPWDTPRPHRAKPASPRLNRNHPLAKSLVSAWYDTTVVNSYKGLRDIVGGNHASFLGSISADTGPDGYLSRFSGAAYATCARTIEFARTQPFTVAITASFDSASSAQALIGNLNQAANYRGWSVGYLASPGALRVRLTDTAGTRQIVQDAQFAPISGAIYRLTWTYDGSGAAAGVRIYANGVELAKSTPAYDNLTAGANTTSGLLPSFGLNYDNTGQFAGRLGDIAIWNRALSVSEVVADASDPSAPVRPRQRRPFLAQAASSGVSFSSTLAGVTASFSADAQGVAVGAFDPTLANTSVALAGRDDPTASLSFTLGSATAALTGFGASIGVLDVTFAGDLIPLHALYSGVGDTASSTWLTFADESVSLSGAAAGAGESNGTFYVSLADTAAALVGGRTTPPARAATLALNLAATTVVATADGNQATPRIGDLSVSLAATTAAFAATRSIPASAAATLAATLAGTAPTIPAYANPPGTASAFLASTLIAPSMAFEGDAQKGAVSALTTTLGGSSPACVLTASAPDAAGSALVVTLDGSTPAMVATAVAAANSVISIDLTLASSRPTLTALPAAPGWSAGTFIRTLAGTSMSLDGSATGTPGSAASLDLHAAGAGTAIVGSAAVPVPSQPRLLVPDVGVTASLSATSVRPAASVIVPHVTVLAPTGDLAATAGVASASATDLDGVMPGITPRLLATAIAARNSDGTFLPRLGVVVGLNASAATVAETKGRLRLERAWIHIKRLLGTHTVTLERIPANIPQDQRGGPLTVWEPVPGYTSLEVLMVFPDAKIDDGLIRRGIRRGKVFCRTPLPAVGPGYRFLYVDPHAGTRYLNCVPERNLAQADELWTVGVEEYL